MPSAISIKIGDLLYKNAFPIYNMIYPLFKNRQDKDEIALLKKHIKKGDTVLDIGANIGFYTKILSGLVGETGKVYAFEPDKTNFAYLQKNAGHLKNVELHNQAVGEKTGTITLYRSTLLNVDHKTYASGEFSEKYEIPVVSIDELLPGKKANLVKIDIQGYEYFAFKGMQQLIRNNPELKIISEFFPYGIKKSGIVLADFMSMFSSLGFRIHLLEPGNTREISAAQLPEFESMDEHQYFNIFISR
jgi:FkbM family methyltransferase